MSAPAELVHRSDRRGVATVTLDSPGNRNALSAQLRAELTRHLADALGDDAVRVVVLDHTGRAFCAGMDLGEVRGSPADVERAVGELARVLRLLWESPKPVVARLAGPARAGGTGIVAACDVAVAAESVTFAFTEARIGVVPGVISPVVLARMAAGPARELLLTGEAFPASRAADVGLVAAAVPDPDLDAEVARYVDMLLLGAPGALAGTKELLRRGPGVSVAEEIAALAPVSARTFASEEGREGIGAFLGRRRPGWAPPEGSAGAGEPPSWHRRT